MSEPQITEPKSFTVFVYGPPDKSTKARVRKRMVVQPHVNNGIVRIENGRPRLTGKAEDDGWQFADDVDKPEEKLDAEIEAVKKRLAELEDRKKPAKPKASASPKKSDDKKPAPATGGAKG